MSKFRIFTLWIVIAEILLILLTNRLYFHQNNDSGGRLYLVEARRMIKEIEEQKLGASEIEAMSLNKYETIVGIKEFAPGEVCDNDYLVEEIAGKLYRIEYVEERSSRLPLYINISLFGMMIVTIMVLVYVYQKVLKPFQDMSNLSYELAKGNLSMPVKEEKSKMFGHFLWGMNMLREKLEDNKEKELAFQKERKTLILSLSHDIKTPMTIITGYLDVVISGKYEDESERDLYIKKAFAQVEKINGMIQKIFLLAKNEIKVEQDNTVRCNFSMMVSQDVAEFEGIAQKQNRNFVTDIPEKPLYANIVIEDMREVLDNILMNAIKYSKPETDILVSMEEEESTIHIIVSNVSEEVKEADCTRIFDKFYRADHARGSDIAGNGLGLSIVRETVERSKGKVWAEYAQGYFSLHIRLPKA